MNTVTTFVLDGELLADGQFLITGKDTQGAVVDPEELAGTLFAWDESSYYGTFLDKNEQGVLLSPAKALSFFVSPQWLLHRTYSSSTPFEQFTHVAGMIRETLAQGSIAPDFSSWKKGQIGWKVMQTPDDFPEYGHRWLSLVVEESVQGTGEIGRKWEQLLTQYPALYAMGAELSPHLLEQEWLQSIGWLPDTTPFRTCLQIVEAEEHPNDWQLQVYLQNREEPDQLFLIEPHQLTAEGVATARIPADWREHWNRFRTDLAKCKEILPWQKDTQKNQSRFLTQLTNEQAWIFLTSSSLQLVQAGIHVFLPAWWEQVRRVKPKLKAKITSSVGASRQSFLGVSQLMDFEWKLALGPVELSEEEFEELIKQKQRLLKIRGHWVQLTPDLFLQLQEALKKNQAKNGMTLRDVMRMHLAPTVEVEELPDDEFDFDTSLTVEVQLNQHLQELLNQLQETKRVPIMEQPSTFHGTLRNYQLEGSSWLFFLRRFGLGACLADDMGLGKTVQFITYLLHVKQHGPASTPSLLICPTSVIGNWQKELKRFAPSLQVMIHYGNDRQKKEAFLPAIKGADLVITSYALSHLDEQELGMVTWDTICLDEAQNIKNAYTKQASAVRDLKAWHRIALTGTPIENRLSELWSIFDFLNPGYLGSLGEFTQRFVHPIERDQDQQLINQVQRLIQPFLLRRVKTDPNIQLDLPDKNESKEYVPLTTEQGALYETAIQDMFDRMEKASPMERRGLILTTLTRLKQLCDHPALILKEISTTDEASRSHKLERLLELVEDIRQKKERCLIFTQYIEMGNLLQRVLTREGYGPVYFLNGATKKEKRDEMITRFQDATLPDHERGAIFILSLRAGGTGLNLTEANHVIHVDRWWNPAVENQATDRAHRIGQQRNVHVYKFISLGTIEERIDEMMERKLSLSQQIVGTGESWITELSTEELRDLFTLRHDWLDTKG
ncbi:MULTISPECIES: DEAD/DEAH box helicase [Brevibacillus]|uniref:ATP-dependent helicase n=1 Tax=Brevibacillus porteri TaxID=2126350 RepID=A0ABX5FTN0_9BACL|nr:MULTISPECIES: DEAD/DEAH box helicase [Brevibacillus]MED1799358.1 DEAD/DEAH box helicase [Brevibacillus porteri]MED2132254.1 DEAD/DEAH box helicase [Brevibacillus porteri]MED2744337.1 DEAD/DEAH box helicase [Brevibacillus porteri]MED2814781.1 DEAD/DEAH box helicase [Brevibacillus porteri]MED2896468.1 DEAD/DEAH box helicase [Brevibacillus porteri]